jgi:uncharacterized membrane protein
MIERLILPSLMLTAGCGDAGGPEKARKTEVARDATTPVHPCLAQGTERLDPAPLRAVGTEPFWSARIEGRCVTYSHPESPKGTRIWTRLSEAPDGPVWSGALEGRPFEIRLRPAPGCSDGMSDKVYSMSVDLIVSGERRRGCAEPSEPGP